MLGSLFLLAPALFNGRPFAFPDTDRYYIIGHDIAITLHIAHPEDTLSAMKGRALSADERQQAEIHAMTTAGSRSPFYSFYLFMVSSAGTLWALSVVQAVIASAIIVAFIRTAIPGLRLGRQLAALLILAAATPLAFTANFATPDIFTGLMVLLLGLLWIYPDRLSPAALTLAAGATVFFAIAHPSNLLLLIALNGAMSITLIVAKASWRDSLRHAGPSALALAAALALTLGYASAARAIKHQAIHSAPFMTARLLADGPGRDYLRHACARNPRAYVLCKFKDQPLDDATDFLWNKGPPGGGAFATAGNDDRIGLIQEQTRFVTGVIWHEPLSTLRAMIDNAARQLADFGIDDMLTDPVAMIRSSGGANLPTFSAIVPGVKACLNGNDRCGPKLNAKLPDIIIYACVLVALVYGAWAWTTLKPHPLPADAASENFRRVRRAAVLFLAALLANAVICGVISGPYARYQSRIIWLLPLAALLLAATERRRRADAIAQA